MIKITANAFNPYTEIQQHQAQQSGLQGKFGATSLFIGTMRDFNEGQTVQSMTLEHYPKMTENQLGKIVSEAQQQWALLDSLIIHRIGKVSPDDSLVLVAVWSSHRGDAFDASRFIMEALKSRVPFWKKEQLANNQQQWVAKNTDGYQHS